jgi:hypothetical protein
MHSQLGCISSFSRSCVTSSLLFGTTLLVALPLSALLCFLNLLGARAFSRGELALQTRFHSPLSYPATYPPRPIFTRYREPTTAEIESGHIASGRSSLVPEPSFYKNSYAMVSANFPLLPTTLLDRPILMLIFLLLFFAYACRHSSPIRPHIKLSSISLSSNRLSPSACSCSSSSLSFLLSFSSYLRPLRCVR